MKHEEARAAYSRQLDGALPKQEQDLLKAHLDECGECREFCKGLDWSVGAMGKLREVPAVPGDLLSKVKEKISTLPPPPPARRTWGIPVLVFASAVCVFLVVHRAPPQPAQTEPAATSTAVQPEALPETTKYILPDSIIGDIFAIENSLRAAPEKPAMVFRGTRENPSLERKLAGVPLKDLKLTAEIKMVLSARHARLAAIEELKTAARIGEDKNGLLSVLPEAGAITEDENKTINAENRDRAALLRLYAAQLGKTERTIEPQLAREFAAAYAKLTAKGGWYQAKGGKWRQVE